MNWPYCNLIQPQTMKVLEELYQDPESAGVTDQSALSFLATYLRMRQPSKVIELGTWIGCSTLVIADILANNDNKGHLVTIDPASDKQAKAIQYIQEAGLTDTVSFICGGSCQDNVLSYLKETVPYEVVYIDSLHGYGNTLGELAFYTPGRGIVDKNGIMLFHDASWQAQETDPTRQGGVRRGLEEWILQHDEMQMLILESPVWSNPAGIAIIAHRVEKPMKKHGLNIVLIAGYSCSGKETYLRHVYSGGGLRISNEEFQWPKSPRALMDCLDALRDGWHVTIGNFPVFTGLAELREKHNLQAYIVCYAPLFILTQRRRTRGATTLDERDVERFYRALLNTIDLSRTIFFNSFENTHHYEWTGKEFWAEWERINRLPTQADEEAFLQEVRTQDGQDDHYAPIVLPHHIYKGGMKTTDSETTWNRIKELGVEFTNKRIVDIGCYEGYMLHKALEDGAMNVLGLDAHQGHLNNAVKIAWLKQSPANFLFFNINHNNLWFANDIILCLNTLHYTDPLIVLPKIFKAANEAVFEVNNDQIPLVTEYADKYGFYLVDSCLDRPARTILWFKPRRGE